MGGAFGNNGMMWSNARGSPMDVENISPNRFNIVLRLMMNGTGPSEQNTGVGSGGLSSMIRWRKWAIDLVYTILEIDNEGM